MKKLFLKLLLLVFIFTCIKVDTAYAEEIKDPKLVLESYEVISDELTAGKDGVVQLKIKNQSTTTNAYNVLLSYISADDKIYPVYGKSNQVYIGKVSAGKTVTVDVEVSVSDVLDTDSVLTTFEVAGSDGKNNFYNQFFIAIPVIEKLSMKVNNVSLSQTSVLGAKSLVSVGYSNDGLEDIYNAIMHVDGNIDITQKNVVIGDVLVGENKHLDYYVNFQQVGNQPLKIYFTYQDKNGNKYVSDASEHMVKVTDTATYEEGNKEEQDDTNTTSSKMWIYFLVLGIVIVLGVIVSVIIKNKR